MSKCQALSIFALRSLNRAEQLKRFLSPDPFIQDMTNPDNFNRYAYCLNNPLKYTDPSGYVYTGGGDQYTIDKNNLEARAKELGLSRTQWYDDLDKTYNRGIYSIGGGDRGMGPSGFGGGIAFFHGGGGAVGIGSVGGGIYGSDHAPNTLMEKLIAEAGVRRINGDYYAHVPWSARNWELVEQPSGNSYPQLVFESGLKWTNLSQLIEEKSGNASGQGGNNPIEYIGAVNDITLETVMGYNALDNGLKRKYAYKLSKHINAKPGNIYQSAKSFGKSSAKVLGKTANVVAVGSIAYDFGTGTANTATLVDAGMLVGGAAAVFFIGTAAAPFVVGAGIVYGVGCLFGFV